MADTNDIRLACPKCDTRYKIPAAKLTGGRKKLKCSNCGHSFPLRAPKRAPKEPSGYVLRTAPKSDLIPVNSLDTLKRWVIEGKVGPGHELSRPGEDKWQALADIERFKPFFRVAEQHSGEHVPVQEDGGSAPETHEPDPVDSTEDVPSETADEGVEEPANEAPEEDADVPNQQAEEAGDASDNEPVQSEADDTTPEEDEPAQPEADDPTPHSDEHTEVTEEKIEPTEPSGDAELVAAIDAEVTTREVVEPKPAEKSGSPVVPIFIILVLVGAITALALLFFDVI